MVKTYGFETIKEQGRKRKIKQNSKECFVFRYFMKPMPDFILLLTEE
jgi:hypothetical protein